MSVPASRFVKVLLLLGLATVAVPAVEGPVPGDGPWLQYAQPRLGGFDAGKLEEARLTADEIGSGAVVVVRGGLVVAAWGDITRKFKCHSVRKSFLSALYGRAVEAGTVRLGATVGELGIDDLQSLTAVEKSATVEQLLQARSGVYHRAAKEPRSMKESRPERGSAKPGERFWYNNWDFNTAGAIYDQATGNTVMAAFERELARPLGMEDFTAEDAFYQFERRRSRFPAYAFRVSARDAARFGLLYLRDGRWGETRVLARSWIERSWRSYSDAGRGTGYGYMWWIVGEDSGAVRGHTTYAARGTGGQLIAVVPGLDLVVVHRADTDFGRGVGGSDVWELVAQIVDAIDGPARRSRHLVPVESVPFSRQLPPLSFPQAIALAPDVLDRYVGDYEGESIPGMSLHREGDLLVGYMRGVGEADFWPIAETRFQARAVGATLDFELDADGRVERVIVHMDGRKIVATPVPGSTPGE